jgi:hypothetical protein
MSDPNQPTPQDAAPDSSPRRRVRTAPLLIGIGLGLALGVVALVAYVVLARETTPRLTEEAYRAAAQKWDERGPANYNLDLELSGNRPGKVHDEVRDRQPVRMTRDGVQPRQERTWYYWTVPGMLDTISAELEMAQNPSTSFDAPQATQVAIWAEFDPELGYPRRYDRVVLGTNLEIHWKVTRFEALDDPAKTP